MVNPFYVEGPDYSRALSGLSEIIDETRERKRKEAAQTALQEAWFTQDPTALADVATQDPELAGQVANMLRMQRMLEDENLRSMAMGAMELQNIPDQEGRIAYIQNKIEEIKARGGNPENFIEMLEDIQAGMSIEDQNRTLDNTVRLAEKFLGIKPSAAGSDMQEYRLKKQYESELSEDVKRRGETRSDIRSRYKSIDKSLTGINDNFNKVKNLAKEVMKGNRQAVSGALVALVKSGDPNSAVLAGEMAAALNLPGIQETLASGNFNPNEVAKAIQSQAAALRPENINIADLMSVAQRYKESQAGSIFREYAFAEEDRAKLPEKGKKALYSAVRKSSIDKFREEAERETPAWFDVVGLTEDNITATINRAREQGVDITRDQAIQALAIDKKVMKR